MTLTEQVFAQAALLAGEGVSARVVKLNRVAPLDSDGICRALDGVKRRTRAGMGRCQAGFCSPRTMEILARELDIPMSEITKSGGKSKIITGTNKDQL